MSSRKDSQLIDTTNFATLDDTGGSSFLSRSATRENKHKTRTPQRHGDTERRKQKNGGTNRKDAEGAEKPKKRRGKRLTCAFSAAASANQGKPLRKLHRGSVPFLRFSCFSVFFSPCLCASVPLWLSCLVFSLRNSAVEYSDTCTKCYA